MNLSINLDPTSNSTKNHKIMQQRFQATKSSTCVDPLDSLLAVYVYQQIPPTLFIHSSKLKTKQNKTQRLMLKEESSDGGDGNSWGRICDTCHAAACTVYCRADLAYLCAACDARVHAANHVASRHERVRVCEACERAPAAFLCKADAASLCTACDADIHSANPLARRHQRVSILPISGYLYGPHPCPAGDETAGGFLTQEVDEAIDEEDEDEAASWLLPDPVKSNNNSSINNHQNTTAYLFGEDTNEFLDLGNYNSCGENQFYDPYSQQNYGVPQKSYGGDSIVPVQCGSQSKDHLQQRQYHNFQLGLDYEPSKVAYSYNDSLSNSVSVTSIDVGVVPESAMSEMSISHSRPPKGTSDLFSSSSIQLPTQLSPLDREARVLRYREKKKMRKFEKTIRYASRKAYAETRPRIKGRFAKRTDVEVEVDQMFNATLMTETGYGIVPSF